MPVSLLSPSAISALDRLYDLDTPAALQDCCNTFATAVQNHYPYLSARGVNDAVAAITGGSKPVDPSLYKSYADNLRRAVQSVPIDNDDLSTRWQANVARFAAYKAYAATQRIREAYDEYGTDAAKAVLRAYSRYQAAEYNTAVARARTGKQWLQFDDDNRRLFPNIRWLPSRSATPREEHMPFYNRVWPKDDPFWNSNQPGNLWNCKCDWEQTDDDPTDNNPSRSITKPGLDKNPATSGQIFTDTAPYIKNAGTETLKHIVSVSRQECFDWARPNLQGKELKHPDYDKTVYITRKSIREFTNQPIDDPFLKNEILRNITILFKKSKYVGISDYKSSKIMLHSQIFELSFSSKKYYIIVHEYANRDVSLYSISDSLHKK